MKYRDVAFLLSRSWDKSRPWPNGIFCQVSVIFWAIIQGGGRSPPVWLSPVPPPRDFSRAHPRDFCLPPTCLLLFYKLFLAVQAMNNGSFMLFQWNSYFYLREILKMSLLRLYLKSFSSWQTGLKVGPGTALPEIVQYVACWCDLTVSVTFGNSSGFYAFLKLVENKTIIVSGRKNHNFVIRKNFWFSNFEKDW